MLLLLVLTVADTLLEQAVPRGGVVETHQLTEARRVRLLPFSREQTSSQQRRSSRAKQ